LRAAGADARLWLPGARQAGRAAYLAELQAEAAALGVAAQVAFSEPTAQIARAYAASDLVLQLSRKPESFGRTVIEALAVGRPVLGWAHGGVGELLAELQPAGAVAAFDPAALAGAAAALLQRPPPPPATIPYTLQAMQDATLALYQDLAA
ncbi:MAG: glycosyltransferase, partial [Pseudoxanthomonas sp.]